MGGIVPSGTKNITANGNYDVTEFANANVNIDISDMFKFDSVVDFISAYTEKQPIGSLVNTFIGAGEGMLMMIQDTISVQPYSLICLWGFNYPNDTIGWGAYKRYDSGGTLNYGISNYSTVSLYPVFGKHFKICKLSEVL